VAYGRVVQRGLRQGATPKKLQLGEGVSKAESLSPPPDVTEPKDHVSTRHHHDYPSKLQWFTNPWKASCRVLWDWQVSWFATAERPGVALLLAFSTSSQIPAYTNGSSRRRIRRIKRIQQHLLSAACTANMSRVGEKREIFRSFQ